MSCDIRRWCDGGKGGAQTNQPKPSESFKTYSAPQGQALYFHLFDEAQVLWES